jgi:hypothetical protein
LKNLMGQILDIEKCKSKTIWEETSSSFFGEQTWEYARKRMATSW